jgi:ABC-type branched-subunit amino acid transport system ATPase component
MSEAIILETRGLIKEFKGFVAVNGVDLRVKRGQIHALIGPNGAGKTTVFNLLTKFLIPTQGQIVFNGQDITSEKPSQVARRGIVRSFQISATFPNLTVMENVRIGLQRATGLSMHFWKSERSLNQLNDQAMALLDEVDLGSMADLTAIELPYGRKRALEIATTLAMDPELMLLDEPTQGMGHEDVDRVTQLIKKVGANRTILMVEHNMNVVSKIADTISVLQRGQVIAEGLTPWCHKTLKCWKPTWAPPTTNWRGRMADSKEFLRISNLQAWYGESHILHGVDMTVNEGEVVTLLGRNGAGRTTTVKSILGLVGRRTGSITIKGQETVSWAPHQIAKLGIGYCPEERGIFSALTCEENLLLPPVIAPNGMSVEEIYDMFPNLLERRNSPGTRLSGGEQQMLAVGRILRTGARFLLLDEISEGLAPVIVQTLARMITALKAKGFTIIMVEQNFRFAAPLADRFYVMEHGQMVETFSSQELTSKMGMLNEYLGV